MNTIEIVAAFFGIAAVVLTALENVWCWPLGLVNVGLYIVVFWQAKLYADMGLQGVYVVLCAYGWWAWLHGGEGGTELRVRRTRAAEWTVLGALGVAFAASLGTFLHGATDAALPFWDAGTTSFSLVAQWMQTRKQIENWWIWIAVDVIYVGMYLTKGLFATAVLYAVFTALAVGGWLRWRRSLGLVVAG